MISFSEFLTEARMAPLYHGTGLNNFKEIIAYDTLRTGVQLEPHWPSSNKKIVSLTRSLNFAKGWAERFPGRSIVIELNQQKLVQNYKLVPFNYFTYLTNQARKSHTDERFYYPPRITGTRSVIDNLDMNQYEEAVTKDIKNITKYIVALHIPKKQKENIESSPFGKELISKFTIKWY